MGGLSAPHYIVAASTMLMAPAAQAQDKIPQYHAIGIVTPLTSYHTERIGYNEKNFGAGVSYHLQTPWLKKHTVDVSANAAFYWNSINSVTPFLALTAEKMLGRKQRLGLGIGAGVFGYRDADIQRDRVGKLHAESTGTMKPRFMAFPRVRYDFIKNRKMLMGLSVQGGWLPKQGGLVAASLHAQLARRNTSTYQP